MPSSFKNLAVAALVDGTGGFDNLASPNGVAVFVVSGVAYAIVCSVTEDAFTIIGLEDPSAPTLESTKTDGNDGFTALHGARSVATWVDADDGKTYAMISSAHDDGVQVVDVSDPADPVPRGAVFDGTTFTSLAEPFRIAAFRIGTSNYAAVVGKDDNAVTIIDVSSPPSLVQTGVLVDGANMAGPFAIDTFVYGGNTYVVVTSLTGGGKITLIDVSTPASPYRVETASDGSGGFTVLAGTRDVSVFFLGSKPYAIATARDDNGVIAI